MSMPLVSVIIPTHNAASLLEQAVAGLLAQTHRLLEIIVIDDGSTDDTAERMAHYGPKLRYRSIDLGDAPFTRRVAEARNAGLALAQGWCVAFLDADDRAFPDRIERQLALLMRHGDAAFTYAPLRCVDQHGRPARSLLAVDTIGNGRVGAQRVFEDLLLGNQIATSGVMARTDRLRQVGGFDPSCVYPEDWDLWLRLAARWLVAYDPAPVGDYRVECGESVLQKVFERGKATGLAEVVRCNLASEWRPELTPGLAERALGLAAWRGALLALAVGANDLGQSLLDRDRACLGNLLDSSEAWAGIAWTAAEGAAYADRPLEMADSLINRMLTGLPFEAAERRRVRGRSRGLLRAHAAERARQLGRPSQAFHLALLALRVDAGRAFQRDHWSLLLTSLLRTLPAVP